MKIMVNLKFRRYQGQAGRKTTEWPLFAHPQMTWGEFRYALAGELSLVQARVY